MTYHRVRIVLLALGVVFGYGSAIVHFNHHRGDHRQHHGQCWDDEDRSRPDGPPKKL